MDRFWKLFSRLFHVSAITSCVMLILFSVSCQKEDEPLPALTKIVSGEWKELYWDLSPEVTITNQSDWTNVLTQLNPTLKKAGIAEIAETTIDFNKYQVLMVFDGIKGATGYSVDITNVVEDDATITVSVLHNGPTNATIKTVTQAFVIVKIPQRSKPIVYEHKAVSPRIYCYSIGRGALNDNPYISKQDMVITNQEDWTALLTKMNVGASVDLLTFYPAIDFDKFMMVATFDKRECSYPCSSSVSRDITDIVENETSISVTVQSLWVTLTEGYSQPFHIVKIPKSNKPIVFDHK